MTEYIVRDGETGQALVASTGTPVSEVLQALEAGAHFDAVLARYPELTPGAVQAALRFARNSVDREVRHEARPSESMVRERPLQPFNSGSARGGLAQADAESGDNGGDPWESTGSIDAAIRSAAGARERLLYELDIIETIHAGLEDVAAGRVIPHEEAIAFLRTKIQG